MRKILITVILIILGIVLFYCKEADEVQVIDKKDRELPSSDDYKIGMKFPNNSEKNASGELDIKIYPQSYEFYSSLEYYENKDALFKGDAIPKLNDHNKNAYIFSSPKTNPAHYYHPSIIEKLNTLVQLLKERDEYLKLRITSGLGLAEKHSPNSLHYQGRAVDLTLYDMYSHRRAYESYSLLCELAILAGFDWVYYEDKYHIHASVDIPRAKKPTLIFYEYDIPDWKPTMGYEMSYVLRHNAYTKLYMEKGRYHLKFSDGDGEYYGYRSSYELGKDSLILPSYGYYGSPIIIDIKKSAYYNFTFNPVTFRYQIDPSELWNNETLRKKVNEYNSQKSKYLEYVNLNMLAGLSKLLYNSY